MIRSFILGLSFIFFAMSAFIIFKATVSPNDYDTDYLLNESAITFMPSPASETPEFYSSRVDEPAFGSSKLADAKADFVDLPMVSESHESQSTVIESLSESAQSMASRDLPKTLVVFDGKTFHPGQDIIQKIESAVIEKLMQELSSSLPDSRIAVEGHTDNTPTSRTTGNMDLSLRRAQSIANILTSHGIPADRIVVRGFGDARPVDTNHTEDGRMRNRRVEVILISKEGDN